MCPPSSRHRIRGTNRRQRWRQNSLSFFGQLPWVKNCCILGGVTIFQIPSGLYMRQGGTRRIPRLRDRGRVPEPPTHAPSKAYLRTLTARPAERIGFRETEA